MYLMCLFSFIFFSLLLSFIRFKWYFAHITYKHLLVSLNAHLRVPLVSTCHILVVTIIQFYIEMD
jgi:hypothetical protein